MVGFTSSGDIHNTKKMGAINFLAFLKRAKIDSSVRWIIKLHKSTGEIREIKQIFNPLEYVQGLNPRILYNKKQLIEILEHDKELKKELADD